MNISIYHEIEKMVNKTLMLDVGVTGFGLAVTGNINYHVLFPTQPIYLLCISDKCGSFCFSLAEKDEILWSVL